MEVDGIVPLHIQNMVGRTELDLSGRNLSYLPNHHLASTYLTLCTLDISNNAIARLEGLPQTLTSLDASNNSLKSIAGLDQCYSLTSLVLDYNSLTKISGGCSISSWR